MTAMNKHIRIKSLPFTLPAVLTESTPVSFAFQDPELIGGTNRARISTFISSLPFTLESYYFCIPQLPGVSALDIFEETFQLGRFDGADVFIDETANVPLAFKNSNWESVVNVGLSGAPGIEPNYRAFYFKNWDIATIDFDLNTFGLDSALAGTDIELEIFFNVRVQEAQINV